MLKARAAVAAACVALLLGASGCTDDKPEPNYSSVSTTPSARSSSPPPTGSPTPTVPTSGPNVSPGEVPPTEPGLAASNDSGGAISFASYYVQTLDWVFATSDPDILTPFYAATCTTCQSRITFLHSIFDSGGSLRGGRLMIKKAELVQNDGRLGATIAVSTAVSVDAAVVVGGNGATATSAAAAPAISLTTWLAWQENHWVIVEEGYA